MRSWKLEKILWRVDLLLGNNCKQTCFHGNESTCNKGPAGSGVCCGLPCNSTVNMPLQQQLNYNNGRAVFSMLSVLRGYQWDKFRA
jgi:hypothetical protein